MTTTTTEDSELSLYPDLTRFYGFDPGMLYRMPRAVLRLYIEAMPRIRADELMDECSVSAYPHMRSRDQRKLWKQLQRAAKQEPKAVHIPEDQLADTLGAIGIGYHPKPEPEAGDA
jgi:hypothetical protein